MRNGPIESMIEASAGSAARRWAMAFRGLKPNSAIEPVEQRPRADGARFFDLKHAPLGGDATIGREAAHLAVGTQHAMAGHDDGHRIAAERLADLARFVRHAEALGDLAVGQSLARRDGARHLVDLAMELGRRSKAERHIPKIALPVLEQQDHAIDGALY